MKGDDDDEDDEGVETWQGSKVSKTCAYGLNWQCISRYVAAPVPPGNQPQGGVWASHSGLSVGERQSTGRSTPARGFGSGGMKKLASVTP